MTIRSELEQLSKKAERKDAPLTAQAVVEAAKNARQYPELHHELWAPDVEELAAEARLQRAHRLIISIRITSIEGPTVRMLVHTSAEPGYRPHDTVVSSLDLASVKLRQLAANITRARRQLAAFRSMLPDDIAIELEDLLVRAERVATPRRDELKAAG